MSESPRKKDAAETNEKKEDRQQAKTKEKKEDLEQEKAIAEAMELFSLLQAPTQPSTTATPAEPPAPPITPEPARSYDDKRIEYLLKLSGLVEGRCAFEAGWISQRMTWLIISQSFLFGAFVAAGSHPDKPILVWVTWVLPLLGGFQAFVTMLAIWAAKRVERDLSETRGKVDAAIKGILPGVRDTWTILGGKRFGSSAKTYGFGTQASRWIPPSLLAAWIFFGLVMLSPYLQSLTHKRQDQQTRKTELADAALVGAWVLLPEAFPCR